ncbi:MAG: carotenoid biosynthesis protein, partial [Deltaproteobacteria bacterium]|nr:carotenoid biosynthesis protein [Deltaproteobacteria bacterium]
MQSLLITLHQRPYVALFLLSFVLICSLNRGWIRTALFLAIGTLVAFLSEFCSIRWGFPYGMYHYVYENMKGELVLSGVPVWDSISYVFMAYASFEMAASVGRVLSRPNPSSVLDAPSRSRLRADEGTRRTTRPWLSAVFMTLLDIVTDPLAVRGDQWFLGKIFYYEHHGIYFGVPFSNFAGWF